MSTLCDIYPIMCVLFSLYPAKTKATKYRVFFVVLVMSASESYSDDSSSSFESDLDVIEDYDLKVQEFDSPSEQDKAGPSTQAQSQNVGTVVPYDWGPIADEEWVSRYGREREIEESFRRLEEHLKGGEFQLVIGKLSLMKIVDIYTNHAGCLLDYLCILLQYECFISR